MPLATVTSIDLITRAMPQDKYTIVLSQLAERAYELLDRKKPIPSYHIPHWCEVSIAVATETMQDP